MTGYCISCGSTDDELHVCNDCGEEVCERHLWGSNSYTVICEECRNDWSDEEYDG